MQQLKDLWEKLSRLSLTSSKQSVIGGSDNISDPRKMEILDTTVLPSKKLRKAPSASRFHFIYGATCPYCGRENTNEQNEREEFTNACKHFYRLIGGCGVEAGFEFKRVA